MTENKLKELYLDTAHGIFTPLYTYQDFIFNEEIEEYEYIGLVITKTAEEVYQEWIINKDKPKELSKLEVLQKEIDTLKSEYAKLWDTCNHLINVNLDLQENNITNANVIEPNTK